jgi:photosystem II stability/assembly factor-like uncharacterized protein
MDFNSTLTVAFDPDTTGPTLRDTGFGQLSLTNTTTITDVVVPGAGGSSGIQSFSSISNDTGWVEVNSTFFSGYESFGPGMFTVTNAGPVGGGGNAGNSNFSTTGGSVETQSYTSPDYYGIISVRYTFTPVPEPSAVLLCGLGGLLGLLRRRR